MKITAEFDSVNSADIAAAAIRKSISSFSDISVKEKSREEKRAAPTGISLFGFYNGAQMFPPVYTQGVVSNDFTDGSGSDLSSGATLEIVCRGEDRKNISQLIIGYGGRDLTVN